MLLIFTPRSQRHAERLDRAIEVLVIERVFIVPDASGGVRDFVTHEPDTIVSRVRLLPVYRRAGPGHDRWLLAHGGANGAKGEGCRAATHVIPLVRSIVVHVALARMTLAPGVFVRDDVFRFGKIQWRLGSGQESGHSSPPAFGETLRHDCGRCDCSLLNR